MTLAHETVAISDADFECLQKVVLEKCGLFLESRKKELVFLRLKKRLKISSPSELRNYCAYLTKAEGDAELQALIDEVTTQHTKFFRENIQLDYLQQHILPEVQRQGQAKAQRKIRLWSAGCSSGEEPYTLAMILLETLGKGWNVRILASDICQKALRKATQGEYPASAAAEIAPHLVTKYFDKVQSGDVPLLRAKRSLKDVIEFRRINFMDARYPINTSFEIIFCRNVIIYFEKESRDRLLKRFEEHLHPDNGFLFLGHSEIIDNIPKLKKCKMNIFRRLDL